MTPYKTLRDLPGCPAGTVAVDHPGGYYQFGEMLYNAKTIRQYPDWFAEVKEPTLLDAVEGFIENTRYLGIPVQDLCDGDKFFKAYNELRDAYNRVKAEKEKA